MKNQIIKTEFSPKTQSGKPIVDSDEAYDFLCFFAHANVEKLVHTFQMFADDPNLRKQIPVPCKHRPSSSCDCKRRFKTVDPLLFAGHGDFDENFEDLKEGNIAGAGVFFTPNEMDGKGRRAENLRRIRCVFAELDQGLPNKDWPLKPSLMVESSKGRFHVYWLVEEGTELTPKQFRAVMERLVADWGSDPQATDPTRLLRVPGFYNNKFNSMASGGG